MKQTRVVLIVDDDPAIRSLIANLLEEYGYATLEASCGEEALRLARRELPALLIVDVRMPGLCGYEVCRKVRDDFGDAVAVILISGERTESFDRVAGLLVGADDYLAKPFALDELLARVQRLTRRGRPLRELASRLTPRELEVLRLLADGETSDDIAARLLVSPKTIATHVEHILLKLGVRSRAQAIALAYREDLLEGLDRGLAAER